MSPPMSGFFPSSVREQCPFGGLSGAGACSTGSPLVMCKPTNQLHVLAGYTVYPVGHRDHAGVTSSPAAGSVSGGFNTQAMVRSASFSRLAARFSTGPAGACRWRPAPAGLPALGGWQPPRSSSRQPHQQLILPFAPVETQAGAADNWTWWSRDDEGGPPRVWQMCSIRASWQLVVA